MGLSFLTQFIFKQETVFLCFDPESCQSCCAMSPHLGHLGQLLCNYRKVEMLVEKKSLEKQALLYLHCQSQKENQAMTVASPKLMFCLSSFPTTPPPPLRGSDRVTMAMQTGCWDHGKFKTNGLKKQTFLYTDLKYITFKNHYFLEKCLILKM